MQPADSRETPRMIGPQSAIIADLRRVAPPANRSPTLPPAVYTDPDVVGLERDRLFRRGWVGCGRSDRWPSAGSCVPVDIAGAPVLIARDGTGTLHAFANSCRHRGTELVGEPCRIARITCSFHAWAYTLDGRLVAAPHMESASGFDMADHGLHAYHVAERAGFVFVSLGASPCSIDDWLGDFEAVHAPWPLDRLVTTRRLERDIPCNWKLFPEVFNEYYHLGSVHRQTFGAIYDEPDPPEAVAGNFTSQFGTTSGTGALKSDDQEHALDPMPGLGGRHLSGAPYTWIYPNMTFAAGREAMWMLEAWPRGADSCRAVMSVCFPEETRVAPGFERACRHYYRRMDEAMDEDINVLERQQNGMASPDAVPGRFSALEPSLANFAFWYAALLAA